MICFSEIFTSVRVGNCNVTKSLEKLEFECCVMNKPGTKLPLDGFHNWHGLLGEITILWSVKLIQS